MTSCHELIIGIVLAFQALESYLEQRVLLKVVIAVRDGLHPAIAAA